jgi:hypothetical protein
MHQWDATSLITCAKFAVDERLVLDYILDITSVGITPDIRHETVDAGVAGGYPDALEIKRRIDTGRIKVCATQRLFDLFEEVLDLYGLQEGDKAVIRLSLQDTAVEATVTDDRLLYIVLRRCGCAVLFLPDFVEKMVTEGLLDTLTGQKLLMAVRTRLAAGFVEHSLYRLQGVM